MRFTVLPLHSKSKLCIANSLSAGLRNGAHIRNRTGDLFITNEVLYRLSYASQPLENQAERMIRVRKVC